MVKTPTPPEDATLDGVGLGGCATLHRGPSRALSGADTLCSLYSWARCTVSLR